MNLQVGLDAWLAEPGREHEAIGITGIAQMRFRNVMSGDIIQAAPGTMYSSAGVGAPVAMNLPCGPDGQTLPCVSNGIYPWGPMVPNLAHDHGLARLAWACGSP